MRRGLKFRQLLSILKPRAKPPLFARNVAEGSVLGGRDPKFTLEDFGCYFGCPVISVSSGGKILSETSDVPEEG